MVQAPIGDVLAGAKAIAEYLGITRRQVYHWCEKLDMPHFKRGQLVCARKSTLSAWLAQQESTT